MNAIETHVNGGNKKSDAEREQRLDEAARVLDDEIWPIKDKLEKAGLIMQELTDEYFEKYSQGKEDDRIGILIEFQRNRIYINIVHDYLFQAKEAIAGLEARVDRAYEQQETAS